MFSLTVCDHIMIAHSFRGEEFGPAQRLHGATFAVEAEFRAPKLDASELLVDIGLAKTELRRVLDGARLPQPGRAAGAVGPNTTTEYMAFHIHGLLAAACRDGALGEGGRAVDRAEGAAARKPECLGGLRRADRADAPRAHRAGAVRHGFRRLRLRPAHRRGTARGRTHGRGGRTRRPHPLADDVARDGAPRTWTRCRSDVRPMIDGLALPAFVGWTMHWRRARVGLIHHPTALETGLAESRPRRRCAASSSDCCRGCPGHRDQRADRRTAARRVSASIAPASPSWCPAPTTRHAARARAGRPARSCRSARWCRARGTTCCCARWRGCSISTGTSPSSDRPHAIRCTPARLSALAEELGIARRVRFAGEVVDDALEALWRGADLFALATHWEGYGMAIAEALKRGAAGRGQLRAVPPALLVTPEAGVVCPPGDHDDLSKALRRLIFDAELRRDGGGGLAGLASRCRSWDTQSTCVCRGAGMSEAEDPEWLALREPFDAASRSPVLAERLPPCAAGTTASSGPRRRHRRHVPLARAEHRSGAGVVPRRPTRRW